MLFNIIGYAVPNNMIIKGTQISTMLFTEDTCILFILFKTAKLQKNPVN